MTMVACDPAGSSPGQGRFDPIATAHWLLKHLSIEAPHEIVIELMAYERGCHVHYRPTGSADARVVRSGGGGFLAIDEWARNTPRGRYSIAHELAHFLLHSDYDAIARIHGLARTSRREFEVEAQANTCAAELLVPGWMARPYCIAPSPSLDAVGALARTFNVSLTVAAKKWATLAPAACAFVESHGTVVTRAVRSAAFRGAAFERRQLQERSLALEMAKNGGERAERVHTGGAWGSTWLDVPVIEECVTLGDGSPGGRVLTWLWHA